MYATCSDDGTLRLWDLKRKEQLGVGSLKFDAKLVEIKRNPKEKFLPEEVMGRCLAISPNQDLVVGCKDGTIKVLSSALKPLMSKKIAAK